MNGDCCLPYSAVTETLFTVNVKLIKLSFEKLIKQI